MRVLDCMSVSPNGINYDTILRSLCDRCKLKQGMEVLDRQLQIKCYPDVVTYTELIDAACKDSRVGQAMKLLIEMVSKECKQATPYFFFFLLLMRREDDTFVQ